MVQKKASVGEWLSRRVSKACAISVRQAEQSIVQGRVRLKGRVVKQPLTWTVPDDEVALDGKILAEGVHTRVLMFNKPLGVVTSKADAAGGQTVFSVLLPLLPQELASMEWHAVGRLDKDTTGLLLFTNEERFVEHATSPQTHLPKRYLASVFGQPTEEKLQQLRSGVALDDGLAIATEVFLRSATEVVLVLTEGRNHQVKRMLGAVGLPVHTLMREGVGQLKLDVPVGAYRLIKDQEVVNDLAFDPVARQSRI